MKSDSTTTENFKRNSVEEKYLLQMLATKLKVVSTKMHAVIRRIVDQLLHSNIARIKRRDQSILTDRELRVALLVAEGLTNAEIGSQLAISPFTARKEVSNVLKKLDLAHRGEIAGRL